MNKQFMKMLDETTGQESSKDFKQRKRKMLVKEETRVREKYEAQK